MTKQSFREKWLAAVEAKGSVLCAGLDPAEFAMGRGEKGLAAGTDKLKWALQYIHAVAPYCAALKPNMQYWKNAANLQMSSKGGMQALLEISDLAQSLDLLVIDDSKLADIGPTNDAGAFYAAQKKVDAVTFSPFAGNIEEAAEQAHTKSLGLISMCLMSNPQYAREKNKLVPIGRVEGGPIIQDPKIENYRKKDFEFLRIKDTNLSEVFVKQYIQLAHDAQKFGIDGIVIGAPSETNHIEDYEIAKVRSYVDDKMLVLLPGVGAQGGEAGKIWEHFDKNNVIVNVGRSLMLPKGSNSTPQQQAETAKQYRNMLNDLRTK